MNEMESTTTENPIQEGATDIAPTEKSEIRKCFSLLEQGETMIKLGPKEVTLVLGITGSGKTTLVHFIAGDNSKLISKEAGENVGDYIIEDADNKISTDSTIVSKTVFPDLTIDSESNTAFYDCPGFSDTRGTAIDIAGTYFIRKIIKNTKKIKIILTVNYSSMRKGGDRSDFINMLRHTLNLIKKFDKYANSFALVVTKVENTYKKKGKGKELVLDSDDSVIAYVAKFLTMCTNDVGKVFEDEFATKAKQLIDILLTKSEKGYERIGIFRRPDMPGPLSEIELLQGGRTRIKNILAKRLAYTNVAEDDFGYAISDKSKNDIYEMISDINDSISGHMNEVGQEVQKYYETKEMSSTDTQKLYEKLQNAREKIRIVFDDEEKNVNLSEFIKKLLHFVHESGINVTKNHVSGILQQKKYLEFLEIVSQRKIENLSMFWKAGLNRIRKYLNDSVTWYSFLLILQDKLSSHEVQKNKDALAHLLQNEIVDHNDKNLKQFVEDYCKEIRFDEISKLKTDATKLRTLNQLLKSTLSFNVVSEYEENCSTYEIRGDYIKLSDVNASLLQQTEVLNIFASTKVFIDKDLFNTRRGIHQVTIIAPTWEIIDKKKIILNGADGCCSPSTRAADGIYAGHSGHDGIPGFPGKPAGNFLGIGARFINGNNLVINANGGAGSAGQDGGQGAAGYDGKTPSIGGYNDNFRKSYQDASFLYVYRYYCIYGEGGGNGGRGGDGGAGGEGGAAGDVKLISLAEHPNVLIHNEIGKNGQVGAGGLGGRMGYAGESIEADKLLWWWDSSYHSQSCSQNDNLRNGREGKDGISGRNNSKMQHAVTIPAPNRSNIVNRYKKFLLESLTTERTQRAKQIEFLNRLYENSSTANLYDTLELVNEFIDLENLYVESKNNYDFLFAYQQLLHRVETYAASSNSEHKLVLSTLYTAVLSKISVITDKPQHKLFANMRTFLDSIVNDIKEEKIINDGYCEAYAAEIRNMIEDTDSFVDKYIASEVDDACKLIQQNVPLLVAEIVNAQKSENPLTDNLRTELEHNLILLKMIRGPNKVLRLLNFAATKAKEIVSRTISVSKNLILGNENSENTLRFKGSLKKSFPVHIGVIDDDISVLKNFLLNITEQLTNNSTNISPSEMAKVKEHQKQIEITRVEKLYEIEKDLNVLLDNMIQKQGDAPAESLSAGPLLRIRNVMKIHDAGIKNSTEIVDNEKINILVDAIDKANIYLTQIQFYVEKIDDLVTRLMDAINTDDVVNTYPECAQMAIRSGINDLKLLLQKTKDGFSLPEYFVIMFERIEKGLNSIVHLYDHLKYYTHVSRLAENIKNVNSNKGNKSAFSHKELKNALVSLNSILDSNVLTALYQEAITTIQQFIFPFAESYDTTFEFDLSEYKELNKNKVLNKIQRIKAMVEKSGTFIDGKYEENVLRSNFVRKNKDLGPFYTWKNEDYKKTISALLNGKQVILKADPTKGVSKHALKFDIIRMSFRSSNEIMQQQLDKDLQEYRINLTHLGDSVYRCGNDFYVFTCEKQPIVYSFAKNEIGEPLYTNEVYNKLKDGDFILSPYTFWSAQLIGQNFDKLKRYEDLVDVELEGVSKFIENTSFCNSMLKNYYQVDNTIFDSVILEDQVDLQDVYQNSIENSRSLNNRKRRSVNNQATINNLHESYEQSDTNVPSKGNNVINWLVNNVSKLLPSSSFAFNNNATPVSHFPNAENSDINISQNIQYNVNDGLILTDLLVRTVTKAKPNFLQECATNYENVRHCAINIITEFDNALEAMSQYDGEFDYDPVPLMYKLENEIINGSRNNVGKILLDSVLSKTQFDEHEFYHRLEFSTGNKSK